MSVIVVVYLAICTFVFTRPVPKIYLEDAPKLTEQEQKLQVKLDEAGNEVLRAKDSF